MSLLKQWSARWTDDDRPALTTPEGVVTYAQLAGRVARAAAWLGRLGVGPGDTVALQLPRGLAFLELHLAGLGLGVATLPINDRYTAREVAGLLEDAEPKLAVVCSPSPELATLAPLVAAGDVRAALDATAPLENWPEVSREDIALLCYTSGTTGRPKGALIRQRNLQATVEALHEAWHWSEHDVLVHALPLYHIHGLVVAQLGALRAGAHTVWLERFDAAAALEALRSYRATVFMGVPTFYQRFLQLPAEVSTDLPSVRLFTSGSAPLPARTHRAFAARFGHEVLERYGMTEVGIVLSNPYEGPRLPGSVGLPLPGVEARITHPETGEPLAAGAVGEVRIRGASVFDGYHRRPEASAAALEGGWMHTGDLGHQDAEGRFWLAGRQSDLIITGGLNVYPREIEALLLEVPGVAAAAVIGIPDSDLGECVVGAVVPEASAVLCPERLRTDLREALAGYKCPRELRLLDELPRNAMGKVEKARLRATWVARPGEGAGRTSRT